MAGESFAQRRARIHGDVRRTAQQYSKIAQVFAEAAQEHAEATANYVTDLFHPAHDHSVADLVKDGVGLWFGCCRRSMKMWRDLCSTVHGDDGAGTKPPVEKTPARPGIVLQVDAEAETSGIVRTPFRNGDVKRIRTQDLVLEGGGGGSIPAANILLTLSERSGGFLLISVFGLRNVAPGTYVGVLASPTAEGPKQVPLTVIKSAPPPLL